MKTCTRCKKLKSKKSFSPDKRHKDGLQSHCRKCQNEAFKKSYANNSEYFINYRKSDKCKKALVKYRKTEKYKINSKKYSKEYKKTTKGILCARLNAMKDRCYNFKNKHYKDYGGRGIIVCNEWLNNSESFYKWALEKGFNKELQIDRRNNNGEYSPKNCRWVTPKENARNKRNTVTDFKELRRVCGKCKKKKSLSYFTRVTKNTLGKDYVCKECRKIERKLSKNKKSCKT